MAFQYPDGVDAVACTGIDGHPVAVTAGWDQTVRVWDPMTAPRPRSFLSRGPVETVALAPDGAIVVGCGRDVIVLEPAK